MHQLKWNKELSVDVPLIDDQHKELIRIANGLIKGISRGCTPNTINNVLGKLREYTVFHFNSEEKLMEEVRYPDRGEHEIEHRRLKTSVKDFQRRIYKKRKYHPRKYSTFSRNGCLPTSCPTILIWQISSGTSGQIKRSQPKRRQPS